MATRSTQAPRSPRSGVRRRLRDDLSVSVLLAIATPTALALVAVVGGRFLAGIPVDTFTSEPATAAGLPPYVGFMSLLGSLTWAVAAGAFLAAASVMRAHPGGWTGMLTGFGALSLYLCLDDTFALHETLLPAAGIPEYAVYAVIGLATLAVLAGSRPLLPRTPWLTLLVALAALGTSVLIDVFLQTVPLESGYFAFALAEDGAKLLGITAWALYALRCARRAVRELVDLRVETSTPPETTGTTPRASAGPAHSPGASPASAA